ncbi:MAG TPA: hypothetical protein VIT67_21490 [Povalibacter sp.]
MLDYWKPALAIVVCFFGAVSMLSGRPISRAAGVLAEAEPLQTPTTASSFSFGKFELLPQAEYHITARVLSVEPYRVDGGARLSPLDFAVGWGPMSDSAVLEHFRITQGARFFTIYPDEEAIDLATALHGSANMHLIPATSQVRDQLQGVRAGNVVRMSGMLVNARTTEGFTWNTSLTRADTGAGACELFYVESVESR